MIEGFGALRLSGARGCSISTVDLNGAGLQRVVLPVPRPPLAVEAIDPVAAGAQVPDWRGAYVRRIVVGDALAGAAACALALALHADPVPPITIRVMCAVVVLVVTWSAAMLVARSYEERFLWIGSEEFRRVGVAAVSVLAATGTASWALGLELSRGVVLMALPLATAFTLLQRYFQRRHVHRARSRGRYLQRVLLVGHRAGAQQLHEQIVREAHHGYRVVGRCDPAGRATTGGGATGQLPVLGSIDAVADLVGRHGIDTVAVLPCPELDGPALRSLSWQLERTSAELLLAPAVTDIAGPRVHIRPVSGLPLMHVERPELTGVRRAAKSAFDRSAAALGLLLIAPAFLALALAVKLTSPGPVFYRQERVGRDGVPFGMLKFRSMVPGADRLVDQFAGQDEGNGVLFKLRADPRVTAVGRVLRRYSLDELPQLINVLTGQMSLVGPRPPLAAEVERYGDDMRRRLLVKPGLTGLWQISGRSDLSWDDSVRLDVRYVENWSLALDLMILWKTVGAVLRGSGAY